VATEFNNPQFPAYISMLSLTVISIFKETEISTTNPKMALKKFFLLLLPTLALADGYDPLASFSVVVSAL
jgi:hypothetical protein